MVHLSMIRLICLIFSDVLYSLGVFVTEKYRYRGTTCWACDIRSFPLAAGASRQMQHILQRQLPACSLQGSSDQHTHAPVSAASTLGQLIVQQQQVALMPFAAVACCPMLGP